MCSISKVIKEYIKENPLASDLEISIVAVQTAAREGIQIGSLFRVGQSVSIEIGGKKQWFSL